MGAELLHARSRGVRCYLISRSQASTGCQDQSIGRPLAVASTAMRLIIGGAGAILLATVLWDAFETIILPRRVSGRIRLTRLFYWSTWIPWRAAARALSGRKRD